MKKNSRSSNRRTRKFKAQPVDQFIAHKDAVEGVKNRILEVVGTEFPNLTNHEICDGLAFAIFTLGKRSVEMDNPLAFLFGGSEPFPISVPKALGA